VHYHKPSALMAHHRAIALFRRNMGPHYDFSTLWDKHCEYEFATRDVDATMKTMVAEPYVNHIPTMTGGVGYKQLRRFYKHHFIPKTPKDTTLIPISRTIGEGILVDELLFCYTHDIEIDWMLPGIPPTGKRVEIPLVAIVKFRGDKLYNEHIYWDQASVLVQIGVLDPKGLPVAGIETANKLIDESLPSNTLMQKWAESEAKD
jgi:carboxymethylenebutenolidase